MLIVKIRDLDFFDRRGREHLLKVFVGLNPGILKLNHGTVKKPHLEQLDKSDHRIETFLLGWRNVTKFYPQFKFEPAFNANPVIPEYSALDRPRSAFRE